MDDRTREKEIAYGNRVSDYLATLDHKAKQQLPTIKPGSAEWEAWERYFRAYLGFLPLAMKNTLSARQEAMTVPSQWPEWFDTEYARSVA